MNTCKHILFLAVIFLCFAFPLSKAKAMTLDDLLARIQELQIQIAKLKEQVLAMKGITPITIVGPSSGKAATTAQSIYPDCDKACKNAGYTEGRCGTTGDLKLYLAYCISPAFNCMCSKGTFAECDAACTSQGYMSGTCLGTYNGNPSSSFYIKDYVGASYQGCQKNSACFCRKSITSAVDSQACQSSCVVAGYKRGICGYDPSWSKSEIINYSCAQYSVPCYCKKD